METAPIVVTLAMEPAAQERFDDMRVRHFPPERNHIPAHLTLFHALPGAELPSILDTLRIASRRDPFSLAVPALMALGRGVAYRVDSLELLELHHALREQWLPWLTMQDRQPLRPHIVIQNKTTPDGARALLARLAPDFAPFSFTGTGLTAWRYRGGPWQHLATCSFQG